MGLAVARRMVEQHEGERWVQSRLGEGTTFFFSLPLYVPP
jgi:signal transduction histidine kinase